MCSIPFLLRDCNVLCCICGGNNLESNLLKKPNYILPPQGKQGTTEMPRELYGKNCVGGRRQKQESVNIWEIYNELYTKGCAIGNRVVKLLCISLPWKKYEETRLSRYVSDHGVNPSSSWVTLEMYQKVM